MRRPWLLCLFLAAASAAVYLQAWRLADRAAPTPSPEGLALPLDDAYIFLQYARQALEGRAFHYTEGAAPSTGASSLAYLALLCAAMGLGIPGPWAAWLLGALALLAGLVSAQRLCQRLFPALPAWLAPLFLCLHASYVASHFQGMDTGLCLAGLLAASASLAEGRGRWFWAALALLAFSRPEGQLAAVALSAAWAAAGRQRRSLVLAGAALLAAAPSLIVAAVSGSLVPDSVRPKSLGVAHPEITARLWEAGRYLLGALAHVFAGLPPAAAEVGTAGSAAAQNPPGVHFPPLSLLPAAWGAWRLWRGSDVRQRALAAALSFWWIATLALLAVELSAGWHRHRYLAPLFPAVDLGLLSALNAWRADRQRPAARLLFTLAVSLWAGFGMVRWGYFVRETQRSAARYAASNREAALALRALPGSGAVAAADAGLLAFYSGREIVDLIGVTDHVHAMLAAQGPQAILRALRDRPAPRRPRYAALHLARPDYRAEALVEAGLLRDATPKGWRAEGMKLFEWDWKDGK